MSPHPSTWEGFAEFPPYMVRILARSAPRTGMADVEIAIASGLDITRIREIKFMLSWDEMTFREIRAFIRACGFDPTDSVSRIRYRNYEYQCTQRNSLPFHYLRRHPKWETEFLPVLKLLKSRLPSSVPSQSRAA